MDLPIWSWTIDNLEECSKFNVVQNHKSRLKSPKSCLFWTKIKQGEYFTPVLL